ncbi:recombinase family protein [Acetobacter orleanensis]|uniref:DNA invertase n=1 Tax=Acetobacter orleanensis TaxID=104099 RepID=A0A4Y3TLS5_9PROT|nr:recombinase family protein [Acetobacter orleanensis]KXV63509.1 transposase [Acetobacter orleanensis]PCD79932.1 transposase [Acetobacter orleanensis]GAN68235.1 DNA recombinase/resolvase [Acetobacter orleanensis JCM 7639]GBR31300.1 DNA resolvase [Acetobacter orleanensis NRIC 0473]GEB82872.1 DNA invertase [Acetobacter orleanensis]
MNTCITRRKVGYARVSTTGQTLELQLNTLKEFGCRRIYREKASGADAERPELRRLLASLKPGQTVVVTRLDRLARSTFDLFSIVKTITDKKALFYSMAEPWTDTSTSTGRLMLAVLGGLADVERDLIRTRTTEGRVRAMAQGKRMGRPRQITDEQRQEIIDRRQNGETLQAIATDLGICNSTVSRIARGKDSHCHSSKKTKRKRSK